MVLFKAFGWAIFIENKIVDVANVGIHAIYGVMTLFSLVLCEQDGDKQ